MKYFLSFLFLLLATTVYSQLNPSTPVCGIAFAYDNAGNRIKREYGCSNPPNGNAPTAWVDVNVFPNPTTGPVFIEFSSEVQRAKVTVYNSYGSVLQTIDDTDCTRIELHFDNYSDQTYNLSIWASSEEYGEYNFQKAVNAVKLE